MEKIATQNGIEYEYLKGCYCQKCELAKLKKPLVKKRKPIDFTMADLEEEQTDDDDDFKADIGPMMRRHMIKRNKGKDSS